MASRLGIIANIRNARKKRSADFTARMALLDSNCAHGRAAAALDAVQRIHGCLWPMGEPESPAFRFCGAKREPSAPYCPDHERRSRLSKREAPPSLQAADKMPAELRRRP